MALTLTYSHFFDKSIYTWRRLKQIADMTEEEFAAECEMLLLEKDTDPETEGVEEEEGGKEDHDGEEGEEEDG